MKKLLFILGCIVITSALHAQVLYGTTEYGGVNGGGAVSKFVTNTNALTAAFSFEAPDSTSSYYTAMMQATNGKLYGTTTYGGSTDAGIIFSFDPTTGTYKNLWNFDGANGGYPQGNMVQATNGKLYGMTYGGGSNSAGVIFSYDPATATFTKLKDFSDDDGTDPGGSLMLASDGKLYGMTYYGGSTGNGVIFSFDPATATYTKLKDFSGDDGANPDGSLTQATDGKLYGMTYNGGSNGVGVIFSFDAADNTYIDLQDFDNTGGANPNGSLVQATDGKLYGTTTSGGSDGYGVIFSFNPADNTYSNLKNLDNTADGSTPYGNLVQATDGKLYGLNSSGGSNGAGVIFSFDPATYTYSNLKDLDYTADGGTPYGSLVQATDGKLYAMNFYGGVSDDGLMFSYDPATAAYTIKRYFGANNTGNNMYGGLVKDNTGKLFYGMNSSGGSNGLGVIFSFTPATNTYTNLWNFDGANGGDPYGSLVQTSDGKLYGMAYGGSTDDGVIFSFDPATRTYTKLKEFDYNNGGDGYSPAGDLVQASDGKLYGMTRAGGNDNDGVIFSFDPVTATYTKLKDFNEAEGRHPSGSLIQASDGKLYGMTNSGGIFSGVIFSFDPVTVSYTKLKDFDYYNDGAYPNGSLVQGTDGKLYGLTSYGGSGGAGTMFSFDPAAAAFKKIKDFDNNAIGGYPDGSLMQVGNGKLYGMTTRGGSNDYGTVFSFDPSTTNFAKLQDYKGTNGASPAYTFFTELTPLPKVKINDVSITEGNSGTKIMKFKVTLSAASSQTVSVNYNTVNKTATAPSDYTAATGTLTFTPGVKAKTISITIVGDRVVEPDESFKIAVSSPVNATIQDAAGIGTILNDDKSTSSTLNNDNRTSSTLTAKDAYSSSTPSVVVYPNPAASIVSIQLMGYTGSVTLQLTDMQGKVFKETKVQANYTKYAQQQFDISAAANGTYFLVVVDEQGNKKSAKLIVAH